MWNEMSVKITHSWCAWKVHIHSNGRLKKSSAIHITPKSCRFRLCDLPSELFFKFLWKSINLGHSYKNKPTSKSNCLVCLKIIWKSRCKINNNKIAHEYLLTMPSTFVTHDAKWKIFFIIKHSIYKRLSNRSVSRIQMKLRQYFA